MLDTHLETVRRCFLFHKVVNARQIADHPRTIRQLPRQSAQPTFSERLLLKPGIKYQLVEVAKRPVVSLIFGAAADFSPKLFWVDLVFFKYRVFLHVAWRQGSIKIITNSDDAIFWHDQILPLVAFLKTFRTSIIAWVSSLQY